MSKFTNIEKSKNGAVYQRLETVKAFGEISRGGGVTVNEVSL